MARVYADVEELVTWLGGYPPANAATLLARASADVDEALVGAFYKTYPTSGLPTDTRVAAGMRDAVCAQIAHWMDLHRERETAAGRPEPHSWRLITVRPGPCGQIAPEARQQLHTAGLLPIRPVVYG